MPFGTIGDAGKPPSNGFSAIVDWIDPRSRHSPRTDWEQQRMAMRHSDLQETRKITLRLTMVLAVAVAAGLVAGLSVARAQSAPNPPIPASQSALRMKLPEGFNVSLFAAEPDVVQPIAMTIDRKGRLWVVENYSYPIWLGGPTGKDRILIFEDSDGDGHFDRRTVFYETGTNFTGIELGFGGVWVCATPNLLFFPDRDGDDRPDGEPVVKLDGWSKNAQHNMFNGLKWGPDGWLWGCNGILATSHVGKPGTPEAQRTAMNCGVWRYHPVREVFEVVAHGTTNPWGLDFDEVGEAFITNCVIPHLFHVVPGAHFQRMYGEDLEPNRYALMETCADHIHWAGGRWQDSRDGKGKHGEAGGGHAHVGLMLYQGDNWPEQYRNGAFMCNLHGHRVNHDRLTRRGSSYVARHNVDFLMANDTWFRGLELKYGPDGSVFLTDWYDTGECHENDADNAHRENGRIYQIAVGTPKQVKVDLAGLDEQALARLQFHQNEWYVRTARRLLQERALQGRDLAAARQLFRERLRPDAGVLHQLRALWVLYVTGGLDETTGQELLAASSEDIRAWAIRLLCDTAVPSATTVGRFAELAKTDPSSKVRLSLASVLQRLPVDRRWTIAEPLSRHAEDATDRMIPLMLWYGVEPTVPADIEGTVRRAARGRLPLMCQFVARRAVEADPAAGLAAVVSALETADDPIRERYLVGAHEALRGRKHVVRPTNWSTEFAKLVARPTPEVVENALVLALDLEEPKAIAMLREIASDRKSPLAMRQRILSALVERRVPGLVLDLHALLDDPALRGQALRALAAYNDPTTPEILLRRYSSFSATERDDAIATLASRPAWARLLLEAIPRGAVSRGDVNASVARQLLAFGDRKIAERLEAVWGKIQPTSKRKTELLSQYKATLAATPEGLPDPSRGRAVFSRTCLQCHKMYDGGGDVGPDLTGSDRANADYILENVLDPSAAVSRDYTVTTVATTDGRLVSGIIREQTDASLMLQTANERVVISREDVEALKPSETSMMPEGLLERLSAQELRDLFAYLASKSQVPLAEQDAPGGSKRDTSPKR
jgi:putative membrane-bound dehydrogenase-like protein